MNNKNALNHNIDEMVAQVLRAENNALSERKNRMFEAIFKNDHTRLVSLINSTPITHLNGLLIVLNSKNMDAHGQEYKIASMTLEAGIYTYFKSLNMPNVELTPLELLYSIDSEHLELLCFDMAIPTQNNDGGVPFGQIANLIVQNIEGTDITRSITQRLEALLVEASEWHDIILEGLERRIVCRGIFYMTDAVYKLPRYATSGLVYALEESIIQEGSDMDLRQPVLQALRMHQYVKTARNAL